MVNTCKKKINVGVVLDSFNVPIWIEKIITNVLLSDFAELRVVLVNNKDYQRKKILKNQFNHFLYNQYCKLDFKYYSKKVRENAFEKTNIESLLTNVENKVYVINERISDVEINTLKNGNLDVIIQFGINKISTELNGLSKNGVWFYPHDNFGKGYFSEPKFLRAMFNKNVPLELSLNTYLKGSELSIYKTHSPVSRESLFFNCNAVYLKSSDIILRYLRKLYEENIEITKVNRKVLGKKGQNNIPNNIEAINLLSKLAIEKIKSRIFSDQWFLAYRKTNDNKEKYNVIKPPEDRFYADPFIIKKENRTFIFFEEYIYRKGKGDISVLEINQETNKNSTPVTVLEKPYHLSYPFIYEWDDEIYMLPETSGNKTIELYKATNFPYDWEFVKVLINNINAVDSTIIYHNKKFWMFANVFVDGSSSLDELHIFYSDNLLGEWKPHRKNPVVSNASYARPAGNIFIKDSKLIRPSQDCSFSYGYSIKFNEVMELTEESYHEKTIFEMEPTIIKNNKGTHTFNFNEDFEVIDGRIRGWKKLK